MLSCRVQENRIGSPATDPREKYQKRGSEAERRSKKENKNYQVLSESKSLFVTRAKAALI